MQSQRLNGNAHLPWIVINVTGTSVETTRFTYMSELGSHIGVLIF